MNHVFLSYKKLRSIVLPLVSSCLNDYFHEYAIIDFLANQLVFVNTVACVKIFKQCVIVLF